MLFYAITLFYFELVLIFATLGVESPVHVLYMALFSTIAGMIVETVTSFIKKPLIRRLIRVTFLLAGAILFYAIYLTFMEYQMYYDLETMLAGAGGALSEYTNEIKLLIFSTSGIVTFICLFIPFIAYCVLGLWKKKDNVSPYTHRQYGLIVGILCLALGMSNIVIRVNDEDYHVYTDQYSFDQSVPRFGLMRSLTKEVVKNIKGESTEEGFDFTSQDEDTFVQVTEPTVTVQVKEEADTTIEDTQEDTEEVVEEPIVYGKNELDIDFEKLAESGGEYANLDQYVATLQASSKNEYTGFFKGKNLIFISAEAFCAEAISEEYTPTLYRMANKGIQFTDYYQPAGAGTTGGEYQNIFGMLATSGGNSVKNTQDHYNYMTMGTQLCNLGYSGCAFHNGSYTFYDRNLTHVNLGYTDGFYGIGNGLEGMIKEIQGERFSDISLMQSTLPKYLDQQPFNLYYMSVSGHSPYNGGYALKYKNEIDETKYSNIVRGYISSQMVLDKAMAWTIEELEKRGIANDTVIVISADHFPYGLSTSALEELYGFDIENDFMRDHNRLIIWSGCLEENDPIVVDTPTESTDILPTLLNLFGVDYDSRLLPGRDVFSDAMPLVFYGNSAWKTEYGTYTRGKFTPNEGVEVPEDYVKEITGIVKNKLTYSKGVLRTDYYRHVFEGHEWKAKEP